jgi:hypothetical protein
MESMPCFARGLHNIGEGRKGMRAWLVFRALGDLACNHSRAQGTFRPIVYGLDPWGFQEAQEVASVVVANLIEEPLVVSICEDTRAQMRIGNIHATVGCAPPDEMSPARARFLV